MIKIKPFLTIAILFVTIQLQSQNYRPIPAFQQKVVDTFFTKYVIEDPYRWMENHQDTALYSWVDHQNAMSKKYLNRSMKKNDTRYGVDKYGVIQYDYPAVKGDYYFRLVYYGEIESPVLQMRERKEGWFEFWSWDDVLVNPNYISSKDKISIREYELSKNSKYVAFAYNRNGGDWMEIQVVSTQTGKILKDHLENVKYSSIEWKGDGFYYQAYENNGPFKHLECPKIYYHKIGEAQSEDQVVFERKGKPEYHFSHFTTQDERFLIIDEENSKTYKNNYFYIDFTSSIQVPRPLLMNTMGGLNILSAKDGKLIAASDMNCNNGQIVSIDPNNPTNWQVIVAEYKDAILLSCKTFDEKILAQYLIGETPLIMIFNYQGQLEYKLDLPIGTSITNSGDYYNDNILLGYQSYTFPKVVFELNLKTYERKLRTKTKVTFDFEAFEYKVHTYQTSDKKEVSMLVIYHKDTELDGVRPTILDTYGGYGFVKKPSFDSGLIHFLKKGGVYAFTRIRGGGHQGNDWYNAGRELNIQRSFDDLIEGAEYLINQNYTSPEHLGLCGASHGGLVAAVSAIQRPDLFKAIYTFASPLDLIRGQEYGIGDIHKKIYSSINDSVGFANIYSYSPYQNILNDVNYPSFLVISGEKDDRVIPFNAYKFVAKMQNRKVQNNPIYLKSIEKGGHFGKSSWSSHQKVLIDKYAFFMDQLR